jgi:hypothetical protein
MLIRGSNHCLNGTDCRIYMGQYISKLYQYLYLHWITDITSEFWSSRDSHSESTICMWHISGNNCTYNSRLELCSKWSSFNFHSLCLY